MCRMPKLWRCYRRANHSGAIFKQPVLSHTVVITMNAESKPRKDTLKVEKFSLLILTLCVVILVYILVARPF